MKYREILTENYENTKCRNNFELFMKINNIAIVEEMIEK